jgi:hypothetical protein
LELSGICILGNEIDMGTPIHKASIWSGNLTHFGLFNLSGRCLGTKKNMEIPWFANPKYEMKHNTL